MNDDAMFQYVDRRANEVSRITQQMEPEMMLLSSLSTFKLKSEATLREASARLKGMARELDDLADRFPQPRMMEAAE